MTETGRLVTSDPNLNEKNIKHLKLMANVGSIVAGMFMKTFQIHCLTLLSAGVLWADVSALAENWPAWRGPAGTGVANEKHLPQRWSTNETVRWRTPLPERGNSTPIVWGNRVFVTQAIEAEKRRALLCFDRATGRLLWQEGATVEAAETTHETNPQGSSSPVTDGERVVAWFGSADCFATICEGRNFGGACLDRKNISGAGALRRRWMETFVT
jgi:outer membrane protein assembly factor BamB